jgi:hypothetical protein
MPPPTTPVTILFCSHSAAKIYTISIDERIILGIGLGVIAGTGAG